MDVNQIGILNCLCAPIFLSLGFRVECEFHPLSGITWPVVSTGRLYLNGHGVALVVGCQNVKGRDISRKWRGDQIPPSQFGTHQEFTNLPGEFVISAFAHASKGNKSVGCWRANPKTLDNRALRHMCPSGHLTGMPPVHLGRFWVSTPPSMARDSFRTIREACKGFVYGAGFPSDLTCRCHHGEVHVQTLKMLPATANLFRLAVP